MRRTFLFALIAAASAGVFAQTSVPIATGKPENVIKQLNNLIENYGGRKDNQSYSVNRNPNTNLIESSERVARFEFKHKPSAGADEPLVINAVRKAFADDEPLGYQLKNIGAGSAERFSLKVMTENAANNHTILIRENENQEMWLMCTKNPSNPQLRDAYAVVWEKCGDKYEGTVFFVTSLRTDVYERSIVAKSRTFKIEGRVDEAITDSLYNIYIADTQEELNAVADDDHVACVPVVNKRFEYSVELDRPKVGRIRSIFPNGSLCSDWIDLDFVPGETYHITVHNGYYSGDTDYESRVGRYSGHSLIRGEESPEDSAEDFAIIRNPYYAVGVGYPDVRAQAYRCSEDYTLLSRLYDNVGTLLEEDRRSDANLRGNFFESAADGHFKMIDKQNRQFDKGLQILLAAMKASESGAETFVGPLCKQVLNDLMTQRVVIFDIIEKHPALTKRAEKSEKLVSKLISKYYKRLAEHMDSPIILEVPVMIH